MHSRKRLTRPTKPKPQKIYVPVNTSSSEEDTDLDHKEPDTAEQCLSNLCLSEHLSDISFVFKGNEEVKLPAHKCILSMRSPVFEAMFYGKLAEEGCEIYIEDIEPETMKALLRFVYSDKPELNGENVLRCLYAAKKYALTGLVKQCSTFLENNIDTSNVSSIHEQAVFYDMKILQAKCFTYILENASEVFASQSFLQLSKSSLFGLLEDDELNMDENEIFNAVLEWSKHNCKSKGKTPDAGNLRECLGDALFEIRFPIMAIEDFARDVTPTGILTNEEQIMLYEFNATKGSSALGKFKKRERSRKCLTIDVSKYNHKQCRGFSSGYVFKIQYQRNKSLGYYNYTRKKQVQQCLKVKSFTGTFVKHVKGITHRNVPILNYRIIGQKISFQTPVELSAGDTIEFQENEIRNLCFYAEDEENEYETLVSDKENPDVRPYSINIQVERVNMQNFCIVQIPSGMETVTFVECENILDEDDYYE